jgi:putative phosphonate metabolism protein
MTTRHAIYFAPLPGTVFHTLGSRWLGRDAFTGEVLEQPAAAGLPAITGDPRRYGFHATMKPPFALRDTLRPEALLRGVAALATEEHSIRVSLKVALLDRFLALVPRGPCAPLHRISDRVVRELDGFRRPPSPEELVRRRSAGLSERQEKNLNDWGYPYVLEDFRFHMTLTERLPAAEVERFEAAAVEHFAPVLAAPALIDGLTLFEEPVPGAPFVATRHFPFPHSAAEVAA